MALPPLVHAQIDVTQPGDPIVLVYGSNDGDADAGPPPAGEGVEHAIDNLGQKYLNFLDLGSGFAVAPRAGWTVVTGVRLYTANDEEPRDPASFLLEGSVVGLSGPWTAIASGDLALPSGRNAGGNATLGTNQVTLSFAQGAPYVAYRLTFPTLKDVALANSMQIGEVELLGTAKPPVPPPNGPGSALAFNGQGEYLEATPATLPTGNSPYTIEAWIKTTAMNDGTIVAWGNFGVNNQVNAFRLTPTGLANYWWGNDLTVTTSNLAGDWHHVAATFDGTTRRIFVDGTFIWRDFPVGHNAGGGNFHIGAAGGFFTTEFFSGQIDEVRIWNIGRGGSEIQADMRRQLFGTESGLVAYWRLDENAGVSAFDATGNPNNTARRAGFLPWVPSGVTPFAPPMATSLQQGATLWGSADGRTSSAAFEAYFEWGTTPVLGNELRGGLIINPGSIQSFSLPIHGLVPGGTYYFRAVGANAHGASYGWTLPFIFDTNAPTCLHARGTATFSNVLVSFSERLDPGSAGDIFNYTVPGFEVVSARLDPSGTKVLVKLDRRMMLGGDHTITVQDVSDLAGNPLRDPCQIQFRAFDFIPGLLRFEAYNGTPEPTPNGLIPGNDVLTLKNHPSFPDSPSETRYLTALDTRTVYSDDRHEFYGASLQGVFVPPVSGNWIFYLRSDNASQLFLDPTGPMGDNAKLIAEETECCHPFSAHPSVPIALAVGQKYFLRVLYKEGTAGDYAQVAAKLENDPTPPDSLSPIAGAHLAAPADPAEVSGGPLRITALRTNADGVSISFTKPMPFSYRLESKDALVPGPWTPVPATILTNNGPVMTVQDPRPRATNRFYRAVMTP